MTPAYETLLTRLEDMASSVATPPHHAKLAREASAVLSLMHAALEAAEDKTRALVAQQADLNQRLVERWSRM